MHPVLVTPPAQMPVSLDEMKAHLRVEHSDEDDLISGLVAGAVSHLDVWRGVLGRCIISQTWEVSDLRFCAAGVRFPMPDVTDVSITYDDANGAEQTVDIASYGLGTDALGSYLRWGKGWTTPALSDADLNDPVRYRFTCGLATGAADVPQSLKVAIAMLAAHLYENREAVSVGTSLGDVPLGFEMLIKPFRVQRI